MGCVSHALFKMITWCAQVLKILVAAAIILIIYYKMWHLTGTCAQPTLNPITNVTITNATCYEECGLGSNLQTNLCTYGYVVSGISILASFVITTILCCSFNCCGLGLLVDTLFAAAGGLWWLAAAVTFTHSKTVNTLVNPQDGWEQAIIGLSWANCGLFTFVFVSYLMKIWGECCPCLACCDGEDKEKDFNKV